MHGCKLKQPLTTKGFCSTGSATDYLTVKLRTQHLEFFQNLCNLTKLLKFVFGEVLNFVWLIFVIQWIL